VHDVARGVVDLRKQQRRAQRTVGRDDERAAHRIADPQVAGVLGEEAAALGGGSANGARRHSDGLEQSMHARARQLAFADDACALEHLDDAADRAPRFVALGALDERGDVGADRPALALIGPRLGAERVEAAALVRVVPALDRARREREEAAVGRDVGARGGVGEVAFAVAVIEPRADERAEHAEPEERDGSFRFVVHGAKVPEGSGHKR
jgi:hypothetical protein